MEIHANLWKPVEVYEHQCQSMGTSKIHAKDDNLWKLGEHLSTSMEIDGILWKLIEINILMSYRSQERHCCRKTGARGKWESFNRVLHDITIQEHRFTFVLIKRKGAMIYILQTVHKNYQGLEPIVGSWFAQWMLSEHPKSDTCSKSATCKSKRAIRVESMIVLV